ncbi:hypothetical protein TNCV_1794051 [Trichonephila clavipes]|nr:hypothetical protein TNCV_1794051 [Trichonephila clavipes]
MIINHDSKSKLEKGDERKIFKGNLKNSTKKDMKPQVNPKTHCALSKTPKQEKVQYAICRSSKDNKMTITLTKFDFLPCKYHSCEVDITSNGGDSEWLLKAVHVISVTIATFLQSGELRWYGQTQRPIAKVLPVYGRRTIRQLALRERNVAVFLNIGMSRVS